MSSPETGPTRGAVVDLSKLPIVQDAMLDAAPERIAYDPKRTLALSSALTPGYLGIDPQNYRDITYEMVDLISSENIAPHLIDVPPYQGQPGQNPFVIGYYPGKRQDYTRVAVTPQEARIFPRNVSAIRGGGQIATGAAVVTHFPSDADIARQERSGDHVQEKKLEGLQNLVENVYSPQIVVLDKFAEAAGSNRRGWARIGKDPKFRDWLTLVRTSVFDQMVVAYGYQRGRTASQIQLMSRSVTAAICLQKPLDRNRETFEDLTKLSRAWVGHKRAAAEQRIQEIERRLG